MNCPVYASVHVYTGQVNFSKVPENKSHVLLVTLYLRDPEEGDGGHEAGHEAEGDRQHGHVPVRQQILLAGKIFFSFLTFIGT